VSAPCASSEDFACPLGCARGCRPFSPALTSACASSHGVWLSLDVSFPVSVSPYGFGDPSSSLASVAARRLPALDLEVFPSPVRRSRQGFCVAPSSELRLLQSVTERGGYALSCFSACLRSASPEVSGSFSTCLSSSPLCPGLPHPVRSASRVSHPPDGFLLDDPTGLVSCRSAHGVPPFRAFPSPGAATPLDVTSALLPLTRAALGYTPEGSYRQRQDRHAAPHGALAKHRAARSRPHQDASASWSTSGPLLPGASPWSSRRLLHLRDARCSPGFVDLL